jgi:hypothetical protein
MESNWQDYTRGIKPSDAGLYLVLLKSEEGMKNGFGNESPILTARFNIMKQEWENVGSVIPLLDLNNIVIAWHEIPPIPGKNDE